MRIECGIGTCDEPRRLTPDGHYHGTLCGPHDAMLLVLQYYLRKRAGNVVGSTALLREMESGGHGKRVLKAEWRRRFGSPKGATKVFDRMEAARARWNVSA